MRDSILFKLNIIQTTLKAPKGQFNNFGKYKYRNCEDILEALKPLLQETKTSLIISDSIEQIGDRYYVKATATLFDCEATDTYVLNSAYAREEENKKGMDSSQVTGATSSYARKYALNGLFGIDDTKDADDPNYNQQNNQKSEPKKEEPKQKEYDPKIAAEQLKQINALASEYAELATTEVAKIYDALQSKFKYEGSISSLSEENKNVVIKQLETWIKKTKEKSGN
jgi:hypothetical protein